MKLKYLLFRKNLLTYIAEVTASVATEAYIDYLEELRKVRDR